MKFKSPHILVIEVLPASVDLILQREVKSYMLYALPGEHFGAGCVVHCLEMADHVRKPDGQAIVAEESRTMETDNRASDKAQRLESGRGENGNVYPLQNKGEMESTSVRTLLLSSLTSFSLLLPSTVAVLLGDFRVSHSSHYTFSYLPSICFSLCQKHSSPPQPPPLHLSDSHSPFRT